ncbi:MAG: hypothetical protein WCV84_05135 [Patescibacteria group bacterium]
MPLRASRQSLGTVVGKALFGRTATTQGIKRQLQAKGTGTVISALKAKGVSVSPEKLTRVLAGKDRGGISQGQLKKAVQAFRSVGIGPQEETVSRIMIDAMKGAREFEGTKGPSLRDATVKAWNQERAQEAEEERRVVEGEEAVGVLSRMRSGIGRPDQLQKTQRATDGLSDGKSTTIREMRDMLRNKLTIQPPSKSQPPSMKPPLD